MWSLWFVLKYSGGCSKAVAVRLTFKDTIHSFSGSCPRFRCAVIRKRKKSKERSWKIKKSYLNPGGIHFGRNLSDDKITVLFVRTWSNSAGEQTHLFSGPWIGAVLHQYLWSYTRHNTKMTKCPFMFLLILHSSLPYFLIFFVVLFCLWNKVLNILLFVQVA